MKSKKIELETREITEVLEEANLTQDEFASNEYIDPEAKLPRIQALRGYTSDNCGYFVPVEQMLKAGWINFETVQEQIISYTFESGEKENGLLINTPRMLVCPRTPLLAYSRSASNKAKERVILGTYRKEYKENPDISICQTYNVILVNNDNQPLHQIPFEYLLCKGSKSSNIWATLANLYR